ncbi:MAG: sigma-70 family RNA polymerase sigma factor [Calditrichaeota bacterium]|nr:sigma-70 family RNA polymerase sigma factor [Calditrichota bacterium]
MSETEILLRCKKGDKHAFGILVNLYKKRAYFSALGFVHDRDRALDLSQEAFVKVWQSIKKIDPDRKFFTWYYTILKNVCLNDLRKKTNQPRPYSEFIDFDPEEIKDSTVDISKTLENDELKKLIWDAINKLNKNEKEILLLREFQDLSYTEISEVLNCPQGTVMSRLYSARKTLKSKIGEHLK